MKALFGWLRSAAWETGEEVYGIAFGGKFFTLFGREIVDAEFSPLEVLGEFETALAALEAANGR